MTIESYGIIIGDGLYSTIVASANGATQIVAATPGKIIKVLSLQIVANAAVNVQWSGLGLLAPAPATSNLAPQRTLVGVGI